MHDFLHDEGGPIADGPLLLSDQPMAYRVPPAVDDYEHNVRVEKRCAGPHEAGAAPPPILGIFEIDPQF
jgi:hypothetical protein